MLDDDDLLAFESEVLRACLLDNDTYRALGKDFLACESEVLYACLLDDYDLLAFENYDQSANFANFLVFCG